MSEIPSLRELAPEAVLRRLELLISRRLDGLLQGDYEGILPGPGSEPDESRLYQPGDDVRHMDWNVTARTAAAHVRDPIADRELETWVLLDRSPSMDFGTARCEKRDMALAAAAAVGFLTLRVGNRVGAVVLGPGPAQRLPARPGRQALLGLLRRLATAPSGEPGSTTDLAAGVEHMARPPRGRGLAVVVSDFLSDTDWDRPLRALAQRHQVLAIEVVDPVELALPDVGYLTLVDPETGRVRDVQTSRRSLRERYAAAASDQRASIAARLRGAGAAHLVLRTDGDLVLAVVRFVLAQRRIGRVTRTAR
ncbi:MAG: DUF58 domain-containing protein [Actinomycetota bacterium]|nr:DUF58 domain-containing protein [Actinomycetota bacterium]